MAKLVRPGESLCLGVKLDILNNRLLFSEVDSNMLSGHLSLSLSVYYSMLLI